MVWQQKAWLMCFNKGLTRYSCVVATCGSSLKHCFTVHLVLMWRVNLCFARVLVCPTWRIWSWIGWCMGVIRDEINVWTDMKPLFSNQTSSKTLLQPIPSSCLMRKRVQHGMRLLVRVGLQAANGHSYACCSSTRKKSQGSFTKDESWHRRKRKYTK